jgi:hypothetical protein
VTINTGRMRWTGIDFLMVFYTIKHRIKLKFITKIIKKADSTVKLKTILSGLRFALKDME